MTDSGDEPGPLEFPLEGFRREGLIAPSGAEPAAHDGTGRVQLSFTVEEKEGPSAQRSVRVPPGVSVFDSASWNGIAIDSTCGGHGTCHKCKVRVAPVTPVTRHDARTFNPAELEAGWRLACLVKATRDHDVLVPPLVTRPKAATVGVGRQVILRPAVQKRYVELVDPTLEDQRTDLVRLLDAIDDLEPVADLYVLRRLPEGAARVGLQGHRGHRRRGADRHRARRHHGRALRHRLRPRHHHGGGHPARPGHRHPGRGGLDAQQAAALRRRRDLPDQRDDDGPVRARPAARGRAPDAGRAGRAGLPRGRRRPAARLRGGARRQRHDDRAGAGHRPGAARRRAVRADDRDAARRTGGRDRPDPAPRRARRAVPGPGRVRRRRHRRRHARQRHGPRQADPAVHRRRHQLRDRAQQRRPHPLDRGARRAGVRGRRDPLRHARGRRRDRGHQAHRP